MASDISTPAAAVEAVTSAAAAAAPAPTSGPNPRVFFDIQVNGNAAGRVVFELFKDVTPITAENFRALCTGEKGIGQKGKPLWYKGCKFHRCAPLARVRGGGADCSCTESSSGSCVRLETVRVVGVRGDLGRS